MNLRTGILSFLILLAASTFCQAQHKFLFTAGLLSSPVQVYATKFTPEYIYIPEFGTVYTKNTRNISVNFNAGVYADFERRGWHLRTSTMLYEENIKFATEEFSSSSGNVNFHHRAYHLLSGIQVGIPLQDHKKTKITLWPGINFKVAHFNRNYNLFDWLLIDALAGALTSDKAKLDDDAWSAKLDLNNHYTIPKTTYTLNLQFGNQRSSIGLGLLYQSAKLDLIPAKNPYLFQQSLQASLLFTKTLFYGYK